MQSKFHQVHLNVTLKTDRYQKLKDTCTLCTPLVWLQPSGLAWISERPLSMGWDLTVIQGKTHPRRKTYTSPSTHSSLTGPECNAATMQLAFWTRARPQTHTPVFTTIYNNNLSAHKTLRRLKAPSSHPILEMHSGKCRSEEGIDEAGWGEMGTPKTLYHKLPLECTQQYHRLMIYSCVRGWEGEFFLQDRADLFSPISVY